MVVISVKKPDGDGFLYTTTTDTPNNQLIADLCAVWNARLQVRILAPALRELGKYGPMKKVEEQVRHGHLPLAETCAPSYATSPHMHTALQLSGP